VADAPTIQPTLDALAARCAANDWTLALTNKDGVIRVEAANGTDLRLFAYAADHLTAVARVWRQLDDAGVPAYEVPTISVEDLTHVFELAIVTEDRTDDEQAALWRLGGYLDAEMNPLTATVLDDHTLDDAFAASVPISLARVIPLRPARIGSKADAAIERGRANGTVPPRAATGGVAPPLSSSVYGDPRIEPAPVEHDPSGPGWDPDVTSTGAVGAMVTAPEPVE
jgi:hypothetical protein